MKKVILILVFAVSSAVVLKAQCCGNNNKKSSTSCNHEKDSTNNSQTTKEGAIFIKVDGNCGMCKERIEAAALGVKGVETADWNKETDILTVTLNQEIKVDDVYQAVANAGHDNEKFKSTDKTYKALPKCCKYRI